MKALPLILLTLVSSVEATGPVPVSRSGLAGINGLTFYNPYCGHGCFRSFSGFKLPCSTIVSAGGHTTADEAAYELAECRASNFPYLSSIAWCMHLYCSDDVRASTIETFWETEITGDVNILPKWSYGEVMANITQPPTVVQVDTNAVLNMTILTSYENWKITQGTLRYFFRETVLESYFGLSIFLTSFCLPLALTWLGYLPFMTEALERIKPFLYPSIFRGYHDRHLPFYLGIVPTVGQSFYIAVVAILNVLFLVVGYKTSWPKQEFQWYENRYQELLAYFMWRTGVLAFCNMPVLFLFSSRNNILLWLTNWSHSTYMLLHRWIARLVLFQALLHSIFALVLYKNTGSYATSSLTEWWIWGIVATVTAVAIVLTSVPIIRLQAYELFLITHIIFAFICVVGCWYHVYIMFEHTFGYETWLYITIAIWVFDRVARVGRILKTGVRRAKVTDISPTIVRIDIPGIRWAAPGHSVYVYFPTLSPFRPWENHPFSIIPTPMLTGNQYGHQAKSEISEVEKSHVMAVGSRTIADGMTYTNSGLTLFVRRTAGMTRLLETQKGLFTLLEGPYPTSPTREILQSDRLLLIGGGIGITGLLPFLRCHSNVKLFHSIKSADQCLMNTLSALLEEVRQKDISIGQRMNIDALLRNEASLGWSKIAVVVYGPARMCDEVRTVVARLGKEKAGDCVFELEVEAFSW
ncbi:ferric-chelate reductase [Xylaria flabelliformis]|nr:ferric-chelate reductase [Xylaria flabelliformis]